MREITDILKALGEENRLRVLLALGGGELCVCQITELLGLAPSTVSKHMAVLRQARLVESWKEGRWVFYRLADGDSPAEVREIILWAQKWLTNTAQARRDAQRLQDVLRVDKDELCGRQGKCQR